MTPTTDSTSATTTAVVLARGLGTRMRAADGPRQGGAGMTA